MTTPAERIIKKCGGPHVVAKWANVSVTSVYRWKYPKEMGGAGGRIPSKHQDVILQKARENEIDLSAADFFTGEAA